MAKRRGYLLLSLASGAAAAVGGSACSGKAVEEPTPMANPGGSENVFVGSIANPSGGVAGYQPGGGSSSMWIGVAGATNPSGGVAGYQPEGGSGSMWIGVAGATDVTPGGGAAGMFPGSIVMPNGGAAGVDIDPGQAGDPGAGGVGGP